MPISPWALDARAVSPDERLVARLTDLWEVAMNGPTRGRLVVSNGLARPNCGPSLVWSDDSEFLAIPEWTPALGQRLVVLSMRRRAARYAPPARAACWTPTASAEAS